MALAGHTAVYVLPNLEDKGCIKEIIIDVNTSCHKCKGEVIFHKQSEKQHKENYYLKLVFLCEPNLLP